MQAGARTRAAPAAALCKNAQDQLIQLSRRDHGKGAGKHEAPLPGGERHQRERRAQNGNGAQQYVYGYADQHRYE